MLFHPKNCPNCGITWSGKIKRGVCDLCGYNLEAGRQRGMATKSWGDEIVDMGQNIQRRGGIAVEGYRPFLPGIELRDPSSLLPVLDPALLSDLRQKMIRILGSKAEDGVSGRISAKKMERAMAVLQDVYNAVPEHKADLFIDSADGELPLKVTAVPTGEWPEETGGRPVSETHQGGFSSGITKLVRIVIFLGALGLFILQFFLEKR